MSRFMLVLVLCLIAQADLLASDKFTWKITDKVKPSAFTWKITDTQAAGQVKVNTSPCSAQCTCGCNAGGTCTCNQTVASQSVQTEQSATCANGSCGVSSVSRRRR